MYDYHTHSSWSCDGVADIDSMVSAAAAMGITRIAITDHDDPLHPDSDLPTQIDLGGYTQALTRAAARWNRPGSPVTLIRGIEIGMLIGESLDVAARDVSFYDFDFVIGSVHAAKGAYIDEQTYLGTRSYEAAVQDYYNGIIECLEAYSDFDVLGHINNIDRYLDKIPGNELFMHLADRVLVKLVELEKGLEVNTSSYRRGMGGRTTPTLEILKRYRELGGETVTIGSDAHRPKDVGRDLDKGIGLIKAAGFKYLAAFRNRKPDYIKL
ncbi:MAG: histidinol-phosphatase HisJ family protein [Clostridiales Family XIII bacterium]|jgi:histidinol-phosphatase (PHP family)|nr:histidinol-phosphatase HisJ family protein [Clostridiales Family XIII bacterium]